MPAVADLELPRLDYLDPELRGDRFHDVMHDLAERSWLAKWDLGYFVLDREAAGFFLRTDKGVFPGTRLLELVGHHRRAAVGLALDQHHQPQRRPAPAPAAARAGLVHAQGGRSLPARDARDPGRAVRAHRCRRALRLRARVRQALPGAHDRDGDRRAAGGRRAAARAVEPAPGPVRRDRPGHPPRGARGRGRRVRRVRGAARVRAPRRPRRRPGLQADRRRGGGRPAEPRRVRGPRARRAERGHRHHAEPARPRRPPVCRRTRPVARCWGTTLRWRRGRPRRCCASSRWRRSPRAC